jgi:hypothetical protein
MGGDDIPRAVSRARNRGMAMSGGSFHCIRHPLWRDMLYCPEIES